MIIIVTIFDVFFKARGYSRLSIHRSSKQLQYRQGGLLNIPKQDA